MRCLLIRCRLNSALKSFKHIPKWKFAHRPPKKSLAATSKFPVMNLRLLAGDLRTQKAVRELKAPKNADERRLQTL
jgi:hypothetical protein